MAVDDAKISLDFKLSRGKALADMGAEFRK